MGGRGRGGGNRLPRFGGPAGRLDLPSWLGESILTAEPRSRGDHRLLFLKSSASEAGICRGH